MTLARRSADESGVALITALLAIMLMSALMVGMFAALATDQRSHAMDRDQTQAYAAAQAGLEKLTSGLATLFVTDVSPSPAQINVVASTPPVIPGFAFTAPGGLTNSGYAITYTADASGNPAALPLPITTGPFTGFQGLITKYTATITAVSATGGAEVRLRRDIQTVAVPVFQFGIFSDTDLSFYAGDAFAFGGRVHTNQNLFLCEFGASLTFGDRITAVRDVVHNFLSNGLSASTYSCTGPVLIPTSPSTTRNLQMTPNEGSITGMPPVPWTQAAQTLVANPNWNTISTGNAYYKSYIRTALTGAKALNLPLVTQGATPVDLIRRPCIVQYLPDCPFLNENTANSSVYLQRYYSQASLRIVISDRAADLTSLPAISAGAPVKLGDPTTTTVADDWAAAGSTGLPVGYGPINATHPPIARSIGPFPVAMLTHLTTVSLRDGGTGLMRIKMAAATGVPNLLRISNAGVVNQLKIGATTVTCNGKTGPVVIGGYAYAVDTFFGCTGVPTAIIGTAVTATLPNGAVASTTIANLATVAGQATFRVAAGGTMAFAPSLIWFGWNGNGATINGTAMPMTCTGYDSVIVPQELTGCSASWGAQIPPVNTPFSTQAMASQNTGTIGGYIKIDKQNAAGVWSDVTTEILNLGIGAPNQEGGLCADPTPDAVIRIQRLRDNGGTCTYNGSTNSWDWWPQTLYDTREGSFRDLASTSSPMMMGGVIQYVSLDVNNLKRWLAGTIGTTGNLALNTGGSTNGYIVYFSDRRGNHDTGNGDRETAEYGFEDNVNSTTAAGLPDAVLQAGEDLNPATGFPITQQLYGGTPSTVAGVIPAGGVAPYGPAVPNTATSGPQVAIAIGNAGQARVNKVVLFRRALKLEHGGIVGGVSSLPASGLTVASENPVYVQGNYNATTDPLAEPNLPASVVADAVTLLSNVWKDSISFENPTAATNRNASTTGYRMAVVAGKGLSFTYCAAACGSPGFLYGTDGGVGNFLRLLEDWNTSGVSINYRGSLVTLHVNRQATGTFKYNTNVYDFGTRNFTFDTDFLTPALLPPGTPMFRDINTLKFRQILRPNQ